MLDFSVFGKTGRKNLAGAQVAAYTFFANPGDSLHVFFLGDQSAVRALIE